MSDSSLDGLPGWITAEVIADIRATFDPLYGRPLTDHEVIEILLTIGHLFAVLDGNDSRANRSGNSGNGEATRAAVIP